MRRKLVLAAILTGLGVAAAGCGGSGAPAVANLRATTTTSNATAIGSTAGSGADDSGAGTSSGGASGKTGLAFSVAGTVQQMTKFAACRRANGEPNFPDPNAQGVISAGSIDRGSAQFEQAMEVCRKGLPSGTSSPAQQAQDLRQAVAFSVCMRRNGVPAFPDPQSGSGGGMVIHLGSSIDPSSPQFQKAQQICQKETHGGKA
jgi:hypothetical protein